MKILHVAPLSWKNPNGVTEAVANLAVAQSQFPQVQIGLLVSSVDPGPIPQLPIPVLLRRNMVRLAGESSVWECLKSRLFAPDLVVFHSTFVPFHARLAREFQNHSIPYLVCPHGGMTREAMAQKAWKKTLGRRLFFDAFVAGASAIQYLSQGEYERSGDWGRPVIIAGNGVWPPAEDKLATPGGRAMREFLFLGRLEIEIKGLDILLEAVTRCHSELQRNRARVKIVGPGCARSDVWLREEVARHFLGDVVHVEGPIQGDAKTRAYSAADVFLHPSRTEGHPTSVLEALSHGLPVVITPQTNVLHQVLAAGAGWAVTHDPGDLARTLVRLARVAPETLAAAGRAARQLALEQFTWQQAAEKTLSKYARILRLARAA
ncbi:glycosyltransferase [Thermogutta sp.]|uniref:glycosyltransferase n=1 Tax=Thermogutta sp. TaxID=1962930 RepID=UPI00322016BF